MAPRLTPLPTLATGLAVAALTTLGGCQRDPGFVGYWDITRVERGGRSQSDVGFLDFDGDGGVVFFTRYLFVEGGWRPDPQPVLRVGGTNVESNDDVFEAYQEEGETFDLRIDVLSAEPLSIDDYHPWRAEVSGPEVWWPEASGAQAPVITGTDPPPVPEAMPTTLIIRR